MIDWVRSRLMQKRFFLLLFLLLSACGEREPPITPAPSPTV